jgi:hypothetical protein
MPIRLPCKRFHFGQSSLLHAYWGAVGVARPTFDLYVVGPRGQWVTESAQIDTAADYTILASRVATTLGLSLPYPRQAQVSGIGGTRTATVSFPPDGLVSLFVTDYREYAYLARPLVGFHASGRSASAQRSVLGLTGFLQHFRFVLDLPATPHAGLAGSVGTLPLNQSLAEFLASLRGSS